MVNTSLIAFFAFVTVAYAKVLPMPSSGRIVGGADATEGQFPYQISLRYYSQHHCGGAIYNKRFIVTAAHCVDGVSAKSFKVVTGTTKLSSGGDTYNVEEVIVHPGWNSDNLENDLALLKLSEDIEFNDNVKAIPLSTKYVTEANAVASGWGDTSYPGKAPDNLKFLAVKTVTNDFCNEKHGSIDGIVVKETAICTTSPRGQGMCHGDSGGPLVVDGELTGIVSWGLPCAKGFPDAFTRVFSYKSWIEENTVV